MAKRQRKYRLEVEDVDGNIQKISDPFSIDFDIEKGVMAKVSQASFTIYNLGELTRNFIYKDLMDYTKLRSVTFYSGYSSDNELSLTFKGTIKHCYSYRQGVDFLTIIETDSGSDYLNGAYVSGQVAEGSEYRDAVLDFMNSIGMKGAGRYVGELEGTFKRATSFAEKADKLIQRYVDGHFFIDNGDIFVLKDDEVIEGIINKIDSDSGLLGSPQREESFITFDVIYEPRLLMGQWIELAASESNDFMNGIYKIVGIHHSGTISESVCGVAKTTVRVYGIGFIDKLVRKS